jgi:hypothetical protein
MSLRLAKCENAASITPLNLHLPGMSMQDDRALILSNQGELIMTPTLVALEDSDTQARGPKAYMELYTIAWICALQEEFQAACHMLDVDDFEPP